MTRGVVRESGFEPDVLDSRRRAMHRRWRAPVWLRAAYADPDARALVEGAGMLLTVALLMAFLIVL